MKNMNFEVFCASYPVLMNIFVISVIFVVFCIGFHLQNAATMNNCVGASILYFLALKIHIKPHEIIEQILCVKYLNEYLANPDYSGFAVVKLLDLQRISCKMSRISHIFGKCCPKIGYFVENTSRTCRIFQLFGILLANLS